MAPIDIEIKLKRADKIYRHGVRILHIVPSLPPVLTSPHIKYVNGSRSHLWSFCMEECIPVLGRHSNAQNVNTSAIRKCFLVCDNHSEDIYCTISFEFHS